MCWEHIGRPCQRYIMDHKLIGHDNNVVGYYKKTKSPNVTHKLLNDSSINLLSSPSGNFLIMLSTSEKFCRAACIHVCCSVSNPNKVLLFELSSEYFYLCECGNSWFGFSRQLVNGVSISTLLYHQFPGSRFKSVF